MQPRSSRSFKTFCWRGVTARVSVTRNHRIEGWTLLDVTVLSPRGAPLPFAIDGYRQHGLEQEEMDGAGGVAAFLTEWAEREAHLPRYAQAFARWNQADLFKTP